MYKYIITFIISACIFIQPALAEDTYCQHIDHAGILYDLIGQGAKLLAPKLDEMGVDGSTAISIVTPWIQNKVTGIRDAAMTKSNEELSDYLKLEGLKLLGSRLSGDDWSTIWTAMDRISPLAAQALYRTESGIPAGFIPRVAQALYLRGDIAQPTVSETLAYIAAGEFSSEDERWAITVLAEELAASANLDTVEVIRTQTESQPIVTACYGS